jgi:two-component system LytT family response regulator
MIETEIDLYRPSTQKVPVGIIRTIVVNGDPEVRARLHSIIANDPDVEVLDDCENGVEAIRTIREYHPDLVLLDVQLSDMSGFDVLREISFHWTPHVIFITTNEEHALDAIRVHALDYLIAPFSETGLRKSLQFAKSTIGSEHAQTMGRRLLEMLGQRESALSVPSASVSRPQTRASAQELLTRITVFSGQRVYMIQVDDIEWIEAADYYSKIHAGGKVHLVRESMKYFERRLDPSKFVRIHRSTIVNVDHIREIQRYRKNHHIVILQDGSQLDASKSGHARLIRDLSRWK